MQRLALALLVVACGPSTPSKPVALPPVGAVLTKIAIDTQPLVDAWTNAIGGRDNIAALGPLHGKGTYEKGGMRGTIELWITPRGERREEIMLGPLHETRVFNGVGGWLVDRNREVRELAGFEIDDQLVLAFRDAFAPMIVDRRGGIITRDGDKLVISPDGSKRTETITFVGGLPDTLVRRDGEKFRTTRFSDWNVVSGVKLPFTVREETGNPRESVTIHWRTLDRGLPSPTAFARPDDRAPDMGLMTNPVVVPIEIVYDGFIFVPVVLNDVSMSFLLDTGAEATILSASRLAKLNLTAVGSFATGAGGGDVALSYVPHVSTRLGGAMIHDQIVASIDLDAIERELKRPLDGILGYDFLSRYVVEIDYGAKTMRLFDRATYKHGGTAIPITLEDSTPYFDAAIEVPKQGKVTGHFVLDTGCLCEVTLFTPFVDEHKLLSAFPNAKLQGYSAGAGGATKQLTGAIPALYVGAEKIKDARADFSRDTVGATANPESAGVIGSVVWKRFKLVLDYKGKQVFLDASAGPPPATPPPPNAGSGAGSGLGSANR